jgi:hypothetical protein
MSLNAVKDRVTSEIEVLVSDRGKRVETILTDSEAAEVLATVKSDFAGDLLQSFNRRGWSHNQRVWAHALAMERKFPAVAAPTEQVTTDVGKILGVFKHAQSALKFPKVRLATDSGQAVRLSIAGERSRYAGSVRIVDDGEYPCQKQFGYIAPDGRFTKGRDLTSEVENLIRAFAENPAEVAAEHGRRWGHCCFCNLKLTDERSRFVGYGAICAGHYQLPWGEKE